MAMGRPTLYTPELADLICMRIATHQESTHKLCQRFDDLPETTRIYEWRHKHPDFAHKYAQAKMQQAEIMAEQILDIADDSRGDIKYDEVGNEVINSEFVARSRLRVDTRKWLASKLAPKIYGDRRTEDTTPGEALSKIRDLVADLNKVNVSDV